ncbi:MAG: DNA translocase FtsK 4TM domain-containing protein [Natronospirillum sp.]|uniref:DNA translocase FtsK n=1 Tax=Natronospirillum sp. TaxID=2812955 RepID=UPI0025E4DF43|nr:DNA translocase FtsK [Natronospirillum sp.]MCH8552641.1 DNA translocase FtsK 4TM domain-containing protein [Natronospirillum sp.]
MTFNPRKEYRSTRHRFLNEGVAIVLAAVTVLAALALYSYSPADPGWDTSGRAGAAIDNWAGQAGAWVSSLLISLIGWLAYLLPPFLGLVTWSIIRLRRSNELWFWPLLSLRIAGVVLFAVGACTLLTLHFSSDLRFSAGGYLGIAVSEWWYLYLGLLATSLVALACCLVGLTLASRVSWLTVCEWVGSAVLALINRMLAGRRSRQSERDTTRAQVQERRDNLEAYIEDPAEQAARSDRKPAYTLRQKRRKPADSATAEATETASPQASGGKSVRIEPLQSEQPQTSARAERERQQPLFDDALKGTLPSLSLLDPPPHQPEAGYSEEALTGMSRLLEERLKDFGVTAEVVAVCPGPVITRFEIQPAAGVKVSKISNLAKDLARSLAMISVRVVEIIPGKSVIGIEVPNENRAIVSLHEVLASKEYDEARSPLTLALGHDISGTPVVANLARMPHLLVAGTTGSGKSVGVNAMLLSILLKATPDEVRLILIDPKMLELSVYDGIPHLLTPVITDMKDAANGLRWCVAEMERRYKLMSKLGVRNLAGFNKKVRDAAATGSPLRDPLWNPELSMEEEAPVLQPLPYVVVVIDEFADMMMIVGKKVEELIARIAQKARAAGIHMILATQRPSVDVITGLIKANVPTRIAFQVSSKVDSRTILDQGGAEQLLGHGDMLYMPPGTSLPIRVHGAFVDDDEVHRVVAEWKKRGEPEYVEEITAGEQENSGMLTGLVEEGGDDTESDPLFDEAVACVTESRRASISSVQRKLRIGYNRAARLIDGMEAAGIVSPPGHNGSREVLAPPPPDR